MRNKHTHPEIKLSSLSVYIARVYFVRRQRYEPSHEIYSMMLDLVHPCWFIACNIQFFSTCLCSNHVNVYDPTHFASSHLHGMDKRKGFGLAEIKLLQFGYNVCMHITGL